MTPHLIDVAHYDYPIDIHSLIAAGIRGMYAKATTGAHGVDSKFAVFRAQAEDADVQRTAQAKFGHPFYFGAYHWLNGDDPRAQVEHFIQVTQGVRWRILDYEDPTCSEANALIACHIMQQKGLQWPTMYGSDRGQLGVALDHGHFASVCPLIIARYGPNAPSHKCDLWQFQAGEDKGAVLVAGQAFDLNTYVGTGSVEDWLAKVAG